MRITKLDGLRGLFSLMIVFYHYHSAYLPQQLYENFVFREAYVFVDFFFVLSGFVIAYTYHQRFDRAKFLVFLKKRFARLYPLLFFTGLLFLAFKLMVNAFMPSLVNTTQSVEFLVLSTIDTLLFLNSTPVFYMHGEGINAPSWSISSEMISYLTYSLIIVTVSMKKWPWVLGIVLLVGMVFSLWNEMYFAVSDFGFIRGLICFITGYFVWSLSRKVLHLAKIWEYIIPFFLVGLLYGLHRFEAGSVEKELFGLCTVPLFFGAAILVLVKSEGALSRLLETKPFQFLGRISYSVYLNHFLLVIVVPRILFNGLGLEQTVITQLLVFITTTLLIVFYSSITYRWVEVKGGRYLRKLFYL